jgi:predicted alpha/beta-fold hydrolase
MPIKQGKNEIIDRTGDVASLPPFEPPPWLRGAHAQTIAGRYWPTPRLYLDSQPHEIALADGDRLLVLESKPTGWEGTRPTAMLVHGLAGCADAPYVIRLGARLLALGIRVIRVNLRGSGRGFGLARGIYHAGRSDDLHEVVAWLGRRESRSPIAAVGFSLGANLVLKLAAESGDAMAGAGPGRLDCVLAANPPIDLAACAGRMSSPVNRLYDWNFVRWLLGMVDRLHRVFPDLGPPGLEGVRTLYQFDDRYTARRGGFASADDYYERCSLVTGLHRIAVPGLIVHAMDDPFIPYEPVRRAARQPGLDLELVRHGGHVGYLSRRPWEGDRHWLDARLAGWLRSHWELASPPSPTR